MVQLSQLQIETWNRNLIDVFCTGLSPHCSNLQHQLKASRVRDPKRYAALVLVLPEYFSLIRQVETLPLFPLDQFAKAVTQSLEAYLFLLRTPPCAVFKSVSDLLTSVIPEVFLRVFKRFIDDLGMDLSISGQKDLWIDISFDVAKDVVIIPKTQRVDLAISKKLPLSVNDVVIPGFVVPIFAAEAKTYFDKNMISGVDFSVGRLKSTFRNCRYFAIGEWSDFDISAQSYAASSIDEIYILRRQRRSHFRKSGNLSPLNAETVYHIFESVLGILKTHHVQREDLTKRLSRGTLIRVT